MVSNIGTRRPLLSLRTDRLLRTLALTLLTVSCFVLPLLCIPYQCLSYGWIGILVLTASVLGWAVYAHLYSAVFLAYETNDPLSLCVGKSYRIMKGKFFRFAGYIGALALGSGLLSGLIAALCFSFFPPLVLQCVQACVLSLTSALGSLFWYAWYKQFSQ